MGKLKLIKILVACSLIVSIFGFVWMSEIYQWGQEINFYKLEKYCRNRGCDLTDYYNYDYIDLYFTNGFTRYTMTQIYHVWLYLQITIGLIATVILIKDI